MNVRPPSSNPSRACATSAASAARMRMRRGLVLLASAIAVAAAVAAGCAPGGTASGGSAGASAAAPASGMEHSAVDADRYAAGVPQAAWNTLALIDSGDWPQAADAPGTKGGARFANRERRLPRDGPDGAAIRYREWDVNPKKPHRGRDVERIVTGDDGSAWYTGDHYATFTRMR